MKIENPVKSFTSAFYSAMFVDLSDIEQVIGNHKEIRKRRPYEHEMEVHTWPELFGSSSLGFDDFISHSTMTPAYITVILCGNEAAVYYAGTFAYLVYETTDVFLADLENKKLEYVNACEKYGKVRKHNS